MIFLQAIASLALRFGLAVPFFLSGLTRWDAPFEVSFVTFYLFESEFTLDLLARIGLAEEAPNLPFPTLLSWGAAFAEIILPIALIIGFATRLSALGLLAMAVVIFMIFPDTWPREQLPWSAMALALIAYGPGWLSIDTLIKRAWGNR